MTLPNWITALRLGVIPIFLALVTLYTPEREALRWWAIAVFLTAAISDVIDGYIARHWNMRSPLGSRLDPLADKLLVNLGFVYVAANPHFDPGIPLWYPPILILRDVALVFGGYYIHVKRQPLRVQPRRIGKMTTFLLLTTLVCALLQMPFTPWLLYCTLALVAGSLLDYIVANRGRLLPAGVR